ncbi:MULTISPECIES: baseplate J/gp47 family protein [unclassified Rhizobium]|uniref:baseplate J/gp47 family protein n=1 Tax=unclassified Rhizobium TaxID=2613769 RepID=UPI00382546A6
MLTIIDLSRLPEPDAIDKLDFETILAARMSDLEKRAEQAGYEYDTGGLETDPLKIDQEAHAFREMLMRARVNDGLRSTLPAFAKNADLDHAVSKAGVERIILVDEHGKVTFREDDGALLRRYLATFSAPAAGSEDGYLAAALKAWPQAHDIRVVNGGAGKVLVYLLGADGAVAPLDAVFAVAKALDAKHIRPLTDDVTVSAATIDRYSLTGKLIVPRGPDPAQVVAAAVKRVKEFGIARYHIGAEIPRDALLSAAYVPNVIRIEGVTFSDVPARASVAPYLTGIDLTFGVEA